MDFGKLDFNTTLLAMFLEEYVHIKPVGDVEVVFFDEEEISLSIDEGCLFNVNTARYFKWLQDKVEDIHEDNSAPTAGQVK